MTKESREAAEKLAKMPKRARVKIVRPDGREEDLDTAAVKDVAGKYLNVGGARKGAGRPRKPEEELSPRYRKYARQRRKESDDGSER